jgi:hypothetical protein
MFMLMYWYSSVFNCNAKQLLHTDCHFSSGVQEPKLLNELEFRGVGSLDQRTVTVCSGLDLVNITYNNFVAADEKTARVCLLYNVLT